MMVALRVRVITDDLHRNPRVRAIRKAARKIRIRQPVCKRPQGRVQTGPSVRGMIPVRLARPSLMIGQSVQRVRRIKSVILSALVLNVRVINVLTRVLPTIVSKEIVLFNGPLW